MRMLHVLSMLVLSSVLLNATTITEDDRQSFIDAYSEVAVEEMRINKIPASITLAQAILESSWGQGTVAQGANNFFCIKCYNGWEGPTFDAKDDEPGLSCFRKYTSIMESFRDHSSFLTDNIRYEKLFKYEITDYASWARGLRECGYATDKAYGDKLIGLIEAYGLWMYDYAVQAEQFDVLATPEMEEEEVEATESLAFQPTFTPEPVTENNIPAGTLAVPLYHVNQQQFTKLDASEVRTDTPVTAQGNRKRRMKIRPIIPLAEYIPKRI